MTVFHADPNFKRWLAARSPRQELISRLALKDQIRDPAVARAWATRIEALETELDLDPEAEAELYGAVGRAADELARAVIKDEVRPKKRKRRSL
jgi:hypothetical protein